MANNSPNIEHLKSAWQEKYRAKKLLQNATNPEFQLQQGNQFLAQHKLIEAIACYRRVLKIDPHHGAAHQQLATALKQQGKLAKANQRYAIDSRIAQPKGKAPQVNNSAIAQIYLQQAQSYEAQEEWQKAIAACQSALNFDPQLAAAYKTWGDNLQKSGNPIEAMGYYGQALAIKPDFTEVCLNLGSLSVKQQEWQPAINYYQQAISIDEHCVAAYRNLARVYKQLNQTQLMLQCWFQALQLAPQQVESAEHIKLAEVMQSTGNPVQAIACYQQALNLQPHAADIYLKLGALLVRQNLSDAAIRLYHQGLRYFPRHSTLNFRLAQLLELDNVPRAIVHYRQAIATQGQNWQAYWGLGRSFGRQQQYAAASSCYQKVCRLNPQYLEVYPKLAEVQLIAKQWVGVVHTCRQGLNLAPKQAKLYQYLGTALLQLQQYDAAIKVYSRHLKLNPTAWDSYRNLGLALMAEQRCSEAMRCYQQILQQKPNCLESLRQLGAAAAQACQWETAASAWSQAIELQGDEPWSYHHLGMALINLGRWSEAAAALQHSIKLNPDFCWSYYHLGDALTHLQRWQESCTAYRDFLTHETNAYAYERLGDNLVRQMPGFSESAQLLQQEAEASYYRAIEVEPDYLQPYYKLMELRPYDAEICFLLAETYARDEKASTAIIFYKIGLGINSNFPQAHFELGLVLEQQQQLPQAIAHYQSAVQLNPDEQLYQSYLTKALSQEQLPSITC
ncbi:MAG: tetratricopeptide repeat protein [Cyanobacteria bacterium P01_A01_bin.40]